MKNLLLSLLVFGSLSAGAQITSTFDNDADGWIFLNSSTAVNITHSSSGGNPGGFLSATYTAGATTTTQSWIAPSKFLGNLIVRSLGMYLNFDLQQSTGGTSSINAGDVVIEGGGTALVYSLPEKPAVAPLWSSYSLKLDETQGWRISSITGTPATRDQIKQVFSNITSLKIRGTYTSGSGYTSGLDNVTLEQKALSPAPEIISISPQAAIPGSIVTISGTGFGATAAGNKVFFGGLEATINTASSNQLEVIVPEGVPYAPITVVNTTAGLSALSVVPFQPLFIGGGRIIPASFSPKNNIPLALSIEGLALADIDGDGWQDLVVTNNEADAIDIYRHKGETGTITSSSFEDTVRVHTTGGSTNGAGLKIVDIDGDGRQDLVTSAGQQFSNAFFIILRNISTPGNIAFESQINVRGNSDESPPYFVGDVDGDGRPELIGGESSSAAGASLWIAQNISSPGNIEFGASVNYFTSTVDALSGVTMGDLDGDGKQEILASTGFGAGFSIIKNNSVPGNISLTDIGSISTGQYNRSLNIADINLDGKNDIIWRRTSGADVYIRINTNSGGELNLTDFATEVTLNSSLGSNGGLALSDINGDGSTDIVVTDDSDFGVFENVYSGGAFTADAFIEAYQIQGNGNSTYPTAPIIADLNRDHKPEVILGITNTSPDQISIYMNENIQAPVISLNTVAPLAGPVGSTVVITGNNFSTEPEENIVYFGAVRATVTTATATELTVTVPAGATYAPVSVTRNGLTARYHLPFIITFSPGVSFNQSHFAPPAQYTLSGANYDIEIIDLDIDGRPDVVAEGGSVISAIFQNTHTAGPIGSSSLNLAASTSSSAGNPRVFDADGDGLADIASPNGRLYKNLSTAGTITFSTETNLGLGDSNLDFNDLNEDGKDDIVVAGGTSQLKVLENRSIPGDFVAAGEFGTFSSNFNFTKPSTGGGILSEDLDNDGFADVVVSNPGADNISIFRNTGKLKVATTQFEVRIDLAAGDNPSRIYKADFDLDGKMDLLLYYGSGANPELFTLFHNQSTPGNINFARVDIPTTMGAITVAHVNDMDGDGMPDIIATSETGNNFSIFKNIHTNGAITSASFAAPFQTTVTAPRGITSGDLNLDGKPEVILTRAAGILEVYENLISQNTIIIDQQPEAYMEICSGDEVVLTIAASGTTNLSYQWQKFNPDLTTWESISDGPNYTGTTTASLTINTTELSQTLTYRAAVSGDDASDAYSDNAVIEVLPLPQQPIISINGSTEFCEGESAVLEGPADMAAYSWSTGENTESIIVNSSGSYTLSVTNVNGCTSIPSEEVVITVNQPPAQPVIDYSGSTEICEGSSLTLSGPEGYEYLWSNGEITREITVTTAGLYSVQVTDPNGCTSIPSDEVEVTTLDCSTNEAPVFTPVPLTTVIGGDIELDLLQVISDPDNNIDMGSFRITSPPASGAQASIDGQHLRIAYEGVSFTGTDFITIEACDLYSVCSQQVLEIEVVGDIIVYNAISPNDDGLNDFLIIKYIDIIPDAMNNSLTIYNRWGDQVFHTTDYNNTDNIFRGRNANDELLPAGTYYYKLQFNSSRPALTGFISIK